MLDESSELSPAAQAELNRVDKDKNGVLDPAEQRQVLRNAAELRSDKTKLMRFVLVMAVCLLLSLGGNFGMMFVALDLSKETKVAHPAPIIHLRDSPPLPPLRRAAPLLLARPPLPPFPFLDRRPAIAPHPRCRTSHL